MKDEKKAFWTIIAISLVVTMLVFLLFNITLDFNPGFDIRVLPRFHAIINAITFFILSGGFYFIRKKNVLLHRMFMLTAFFLSLIFLTSYVIYHSLSAPTSYGGEGILKGIYYFILITHIILAAIILPLVLFTFYYALTGKFEKHKRIARWTLPLWLYVTSTGVAVYLMISPYY